MTVPGYVQIHVHAALLSAQDMSRTSGPRDSQGDKTTNKLEGSTTMRSATALFASCALLFSTPATSQLPPIPANCKKGEKPCDVTIIVPAGCGGGIHVAPDPIVVENKDVKIAWTIRSSGTWIFTEKGIVIHTGADKAFSAPSKESDTSFVATRIPAKPGIYKYDITLKRGTEVCKHDPTVVNQ